MAMLPIPAIVISRVVVAYRPGLLAVVHVTEVDVAALTAHGCSSMTME